MLFGMGPNLGRWCPIYVAYLEDRSHAAYTDTSELLLHRSRSTARRRRNAPSISQLDRHDAVGRLHQIAQRCKREWLIRRAGAKALILLSSKPGDFSG